MNRIINFAATILFIFLLGCSATAKNDCSISKEGTKHGNLGTKYWESGQFDLAEKEMREAIKHVQEWGQQEWGRRNGVRSCNDTFYLIGCLHGKAATN